jgi:hypothetical protein
MSEAERAEFEALSAGLEERINELMPFIGPFAQRAAAVTTNPEGRKTLISVLVKAAIAPFFHAFDDKISRRCLVETLESMAAEIRKAG